jgi:sec-independent protein translocase protein TatA
MNTMLAVLGIGGWEVILILAVVLILFGAKKLPELAKGLGSGIKEFKKASREVTDELQNAGNDTPAPKTTPPANTTAQTQSLPQPQPQPQSKVPETKVI